MKMIPLTQGKCAMVDDEDFDFLNQWKWCVQKSSDRWYAVRHIKGCDGRRQIRVCMHRILIAAIGLRFGDHKDGNGLNNQKFNLRPASNSQNLANSRIYRTNTSGLKGVDWRPKNRKWRAQIKFNGKKMHLGLFHDRIAAARAYDNAALKLFGEFAKTNTAMELI